MLIERFQPILDAARNSQLLSEASDINTDQFLTRLQSALRFRLEVVYHIELPYDHSIVKATLWLSPVSLDEITHLAGSGTGALSSYVNDDVPEAYFEAADFAVEAELTSFLPCQGTARLTLSAFYPPGATIFLPDDVSLEMPLMKTGWELAQQGGIEEGKYVFPLVLRNMDALAVDDSIQTSPTSTLTTVLDITLTHTSVE